MQPNTLSWVYLRNYWAHRSGSPTKICGISSGNGLKHCQCCYSLMTGHKFTILINDENFIFEKANFSCAKSAQVFKKLIFTSVKLSWFTVDLLFKGKAGWNKWFVSTNPSNPKFYFFYRLYLIQMVFSDLWARNMHFFGVGNKIFL